MKIALIVIGIIIVSLTGIYAYYGGFMKLTVITGKQGGETMVYEKVTGDYSQTSTYTNKLYYELLNNDRVETTKGIGIFYDNPRKVEKTKLRSEVGCIIDDTDSTTVGKLSNKYLLKILPEQECISAEFPLKGSLSFIIGVLKAYPALNDYSEAHGYKDSPVTEIYDMVNKKIVYRKEIVK